MLEDVQHLAAHTDFLRKSTQILPVMVPVQAAVDVDTLVYVVLSLLHILTQKAQRM